MILLLCGLIVYLNLFQIWYKPYKMEKLSTILLITLLPSQMFKNLTLFLPYPTYEIYTSLGFVCKKRESSHALAFAFPHFAIHLMMSYGDPTNEYFFVFILFSIIWGN